MYEHESLDYSLDHRLTILNKKHYWIILQSEAVVTIYIEYRQVCIVTAHGRRQNRRPVIMFCVSERKPRSIQCSTVRIPVVESQVCPCLELCRKDGEYRVVHHVPRSNCAKTPFPR